MTRLSLTAVADLAREVGLPDYLADEIAWSVTEGDFADERIAVFAVQQAREELIGF
jgi:hypothetical protein